jgi:hypothetical protein
MPDSASVAHRRGRPKRAWQAPINTRVSTVTAAVTWCATAAAATDSRHVIAKGTFSRGASLHLRTAQTASIRKGSAAVW